MRNAGPCWYFGLAAALGLPGRHSQDCSGGQLTRDPGQDMKGVRKHGKADIRKLKSILTLWMDQTKPPPKQLLFYMVR